MPDTCPACARKAAFDNGWRELPAFLGFGHDPGAHRLYWALIKNGITVKSLAGMDDADLLDLRGIGPETVALIRLRVPAPLRAGAVTGRG